MTAPLLRGVSCAPPPSVVYDVHTTQAMSDGGSSPSVNVHTATADLTTLGMATAATENNNNTGDS
eukprot:10761387-Karenia_brevis.AAC.1